MLENNGIFLFFQDGMVFFVINSPHDREGTELLYYSESKISVPVIISDELGPA